MENQKRRLTKYGKFHKEEGGGGLARSTKIYNRKKLSIPGGGGSRKFAVFPHSVSF